MSASLIGRLGSSTFRLSTTTVSMSLTGSRFSSESAPRPFHYGIRGRGGTIFGSALPSDERQGHDRLFHPAAPGDLHRPGLEPGPFLRTQHALSCFVEHDPHHLISAA